MVDRGGRKPLDRTGQGKRIWRVELELVRIQESKRRSRKGRKEMVYRGDRGF